MKKKLIPYLCAVLLLLACWSARADAAISFVNSWSAGQGVTAPIDTSTGTQAQVGDVEVATVSTYNSSEITIVSATGWTLVTPLTTDTEPNTIATYYKVVGAGDIGATWTFTSNGGYYTVVGITDFRGVNNGTPIDASGAVNQSTPSMTATALSITLTYSGDALLWVITSNGVPDDLILPSGYTSSVSAIGGSVSNNTAYLLGAASGATGNVSGSMFEALTYQAVLIGLEPAAAGPTPTATATATATATPTSGATPSNTIMSCPQSGFVSGPGAGCSTMMGLVN